MRIALWTAGPALACGAALVCTPAGDWLGDRLIHEDPLEPGDYIVVLGGDTERAVEAARLYAQGWAKTIVVSSWQQDVDHYRRVMMMYGVPESAILFDRASDRTAAHPDSVAKRLGIDREKARMIVVTSVYHTSRARACFVAAGYKRIIMRAPAVRMYQHDSMGIGWGYRFRELPNWVREVAGWGLYKLRGWL